MPQTEYGEKTEEAKKLIEELKELKARATKITAELQNAGDKKSADALKEDLKKEM